MVLPFLALVLGLATAQATDPRDALLDTYANAGQQADFLFVLDTSCSMLPLAERTRANFASLAAALPEGDRVEVIGFHTDATVIFPGRAVEADRRAGIVSELSELALPSGRNTDVGAALALTAERLNRPGAPDLQFVFMFSDFCHEPARGSAYNTPGKGCRTVGGISDIAETVSRTRAGATVVPVAVLLAPSSRDGLETLFGVFGSGATVDPATTSVDAWFEEFKQEIAYRKLAAVVGAELETLDLTVALAGQSDGEATLAFSTGMPHLSVVLDDLSVTAPEGYRATASAQRLELTQTGELSVSVGLPEPPFAFFPTTRQLEPELKITASVGVEPADALGRLDLEPAQGSRELAVKVPVAQAYGLSALVAWGSVGLGALLVGLLGSLGLARLRPAHLGGRLTGRGPDGERSSIELDGKSEVAFRFTDDHSLETCSPGGAIAILRAQHSGWAVQYTIELKSGDLELNRERLPRGSYPTGRGQLILSSGDSRLNWE